MISFKAVLSCFQTLRAPRHLPRLWKIQRRCRIQTRRNKNIGFYYLCPHSPRLMSALWVYTSHPIKPLHQSGWRFYSIEKEVPGVILPWH